MREEAVDLYISVRERLQFQRLVFAFERALDERPIPLGSLQRYVGTLETFGEEWHDMTTPATRLLNVARNGAHPRPMREQAQSEAVSLVRQIVVRGKERVRA